MAFPVGAAHSTNAHALCVTCPGRRYDSHNVAMEQFVLATAGDRRRMPEADFRRALRDFGVCPRLVTPDDVTIALRMTARGCAAAGGCCGQTRAVRPKALRVWTHPRTLDICISPRAQIPAGTHARAGARRVRAAARTPRPARAE